MARRERRFGPLRASLPSAGLLPQQLGPESLAEAVSDGSRAMTIHKSQGATEKDGAVVTLDDTVRQPCQTYVGLSRVKRLADLFLIAFTESAMIPAVGVEAALLQLRLQQPHITQGEEQKAYLWKELSAATKARSEAKRQQARGAGGHAGWSASQDITGNFTRHGSSAADATG